MFVERPAFVNDIPANAAPEYLEFWRLWQESQFFDCHEVLEWLWRGSPRGPQRDFYHGLIHAAVTLYQHRRGNAVGAARQWERAQAKLAQFAPAFYGVSVDELLRSVGEEIAPSLHGLSEEQARRVEALRRDLCRKISGR